MAVYGQTTASTVSNLYWVPHLKYVWAVARYSSEDLYVLECPIDPTLEEEDLALDLSSSSLHHIAVNLQHVSEYIATCLQSGQLENLIIPVSNANDLIGPDNICDLYNVCEASVLHSLRERFFRDSIYANIGRIVIALNPFKEIPDLYDLKTVNQYIQIENPYRLPPHIYQVAAAAFRRLSEARTLQSILITGESGSGKTESTKLMLEFLVQASSRQHLLPKKTSTIRRAATFKQLHSRRTFHSTGGKRGAKEGDGNLTPIEDKLLRVNFLLESFGNATTSRNPNSSRFGKWIEVHFDRSSALIGASITAYLLELPRVTRHVAGERGFHVFYQFLLALEHDLSSLAANYGLEVGTEGIPFYRYLTPENGETSTLSSVNDDAGFNELRTSFSALRFEPQERDCLFSVVAALLHIGNFNFEAQSIRPGVEGCVLANDSDSHLQSASRLLQLDAQLIRQCMEYREFKTGGECIQVPLKTPEAEAARDSFTKLIYGCLFDWILYKANATLQMHHTQDFSSDSCFIGILDVAGFESFDVNGFEQLCINLANEKLQYQFNWDIFQTELNAYAEEGLEGLDLQFSDNTDVLELIEGKNGLLSRLDEELFVPKGSDQRFVSKFLQAVGQHPRVLRSKISETCQFTIAHFAAPVTYTALGWLEKNKYTPPKLAVTALHTSTNPVVQAMISDSVIRRLDDPQRKTSSRPTVGSCFKQDLERLTEKIKSTETHYIRCLKPNPEMLPRTVDASDTLRQLRCSGAMEAIAIRKAGYPVRMAHFDFLVRYSVTYGRRSTVLMAMEDVAAACQMLIQHLNTSFGLPLEDMVVGYTRVFLTDRVHESLNEFRNLAMAGPATRIQAAFRGYRVRKYAVQALELSRQLGPILGVGVAARRQGGGFLFPNSVINGVATPSELAVYVNTAGTLLEKFTDLLPEFHPSTFPKALDIFSSMHREAEILVEAERLLQDDSLNLAKLSTVYEKAQRFDIRHSLLTQLKYRVDQIQFELSIAADAEYYFQNGADIKTIDDLLSQINEQSAKNNFHECITKPLRRLVPQLRALRQDYYRSSGTPMEEEEEDYQATAEHDGKLYPNGYHEEETQVDAASSEKYGAALSQKYSMASASSDVTYSQESSEWDWSSDEQNTVTESEDDGAPDWSNLSSPATNSFARKSVPTSAAKFMRELRSAVAVLDFERLDLLLQAYEESGLSSRHSREYLHAKEVHANLSLPEWVNAEIKEAVVSVVWGANNQTSVIRLTNLIKRANALGLEGPDVDSGKKALECLRASPVGLRSELSPSSGSKRTAEQINIVTALDVKRYPGLAVNQKKQYNFFAKLLRGRKIGDPDAICSHSYDRLQKPLLVYEKGSQEERRALDLFGLIQTYMGDRRCVACDYLADDIVSCGLTFPSIRDELYLQLMKQLTHNSRLSSEGRGWSLMLYCCQNFIPSADLVPYVRYFLFQRTAAIGDFSRGVFDENGEIAKQALKEFDRTAASRVSRTRPRRPDQLGETPSGVEEADEWKADIIVRLMDESRQKVSIDYDTTIADVITEICSRFNMDTAGWTTMVLFEVDDSIVTSSMLLLDILGFDLLSQKVIQSALYALWRFPQFHVIPETQRVWDVWDPSTEDFPTLLFRRRLISTSEMLYPHPYHAHLTYKQLLWEYRKYPVPEPIAVLAQITARILIAEKWAPSTIAFEGAVPARSNAVSTTSAFSYEANTRAALRALAITYHLLESSGYIPTLYATQHPRFQTEWEAQVQRVYLTLDPDEHQLLAINSVLTNMRQLKVLENIVSLM